MCIVVDNYAKSYEILFNHHCISIWSIHIDIAAYYHLSRVDLQCFHAIASCSTMVTSYTSVRDCGLNDKLYNILLLFIQFFDCFVCFAFILILYVPCLFIVFY
eukprot:686220_1